ncbi:phosphate-starvation-inducible PsiE family protein [Streptomyces sp. NPDC002668]|uniref:phosphate-starvation-inducible PsiE family protein n=1 Tax=Streptomyces sp. NPDC002668 TaxID=3154422 RepID=UPI00331B6E2D
MLSALDYSLVLFIVAELLHTVRLTLRNRTLDAEPFLVVGVIAGIRKVLIVTAEPDKSFTWSSQGIELLILICLILVATVSVWRRETHPDDSPGKGSRPAGPGTDAGGCALHRARSTARRPPHP